MNFYIQQHYLKNLYFEYYSSGAHYWKKNYHSEDYYQDILNPDPSHPIYIIGEAFSQHQAWIEGALQTASDTYHTYFENISNKIDGGAFKKK